MNAVVDLARMAPLLDRAAELLDNAQALLVTAGAGMGVDSGLPDFRGPEGFWNAYPAYRHLGLSFVDLANPHWFQRDPALAWGFYGHRRNLYRKTPPHEGFGVVKRWSERVGRSFVFTSNVDAHFERSGFARDRIVECHGSLEHEQCSAACGIGIFAASEEETNVDPVSFRATEPFPHCPECGALSRPNVLMFDDLEWEPERTEGQFRRLNEWLDAFGSQGGVIVECGAGSAVPTVRSFGDRLARAGWNLVRINPREPAGLVGSLSIPLGALEAIRAIDERWS